MQPSPRPDTVSIEHTSAKHHIGLLLFDGVEELDAVGPWEVLAYWTRHHPEDGWSVSCLSAGGRDVIGAKNLVLGAHHSLDDAPELDVLIHPGGNGTRRLLRDPEHLDWIRAQRDAVPLMASVCSGSLVYAAAGLLTSRPATTHWASLNLLSEIDPTVITDVASPVRRRRRRHHQCRRLRGHRHGPAPRRPPRRDRAGPRGPSRHPVRPAPTGLTGHVTMPRAMARQPGHLAGATMPHGATLRSRSHQPALTEGVTAMASTRIVEEERGTYTGQIRPQHNGYWAGDFSTSASITSGATLPVHSSWR